MIGKEIVKWTKWFYRALVVLILTLYSIGPWYYIDGYQVHGGFWFDEFKCSIFIVIGLIVIALSFKKWERFFTVALIISGLVLVAFFGFGIYFPIANKYAMSKNWWLITIISGVLLIVSIIGIIFERRSANEELVETKNIATRIVTTSIYGIITIILVIVSIVVVLDNGWKIKDDTLYIEREIGSNYVLFGEKTFSRLKVKEGVKGVYDIGLICNQELEEVDLPNSLEVIGESTFKYCYNLKKMSIPRNVKIIEESAFDHCKNLYEIEFSQNLEVIEQYAFDGCDNLREIIIPETVEEIGNRAFPKNTLLIVYKGSYAEKWAIENGYEYEIR